MLFHVHMQVNLPADMDPETRSDLILREKAYSQDLQNRRKWPHIWRIVGEYANYSIVDADTNDELHQMLSALPLFPYMKIKVTPLATHPSDVNA